MDSKLFVTNLLILLFVFNCSKSSSGSSSGLLGLVALASSGVAKPSIDTSTSTSTSTSFTGKCKGTTMEEVTGTLPTSYISGYYYTGMSDFSLLSSSSPSVYLFAYPSSISSNKISSLSYTSKLYNSSFYGHEQLRTDTIQLMYPQGQNTGHYVHTYSSGFSTFTNQQSTGQELRYELVARSQVSFTYRIIRNCKSMDSDENSFTPDTTTNSKSSGLAKVWSNSKTMKVNLINVNNAVSSAPSVSLARAISTFKSIYSQNSVKIDITTMDSSYSYGNSVTSVSNTISNGSLGDLYSKSSSAQISDGFNIYILTTGPSGVLGISSGIPGEFAKVGSAYGGVAVFVESHRSSGSAGSAFVNSDQDFIAETMAHELGHFLGLFHSTENGGYTGSSNYTRDPLVETPYCNQSTTTVANCSTNNFNQSGASNNMFWTGPFTTTGQRELTGEQGWILRIHPLVK